jgi:hypothetical protein
MWSLGWGPQETKRYFQEDITLMPQWFLLFCFVKFFTSYQGTPLSFAQPFPYQNHLKHFITAQNLGVLPSAYLDLATPCKGSSIT